MDKSDLIGTVTHDTHRIKRVLGKGGMGVVFEAEHVRLTQKRFAVKVLHPSLAEDAEIFARFRREAEIATSLGHPNIVDVLDFYHLDDGRPCIVMEYLEGESLYERQKRLGPLSPVELADLILQLSEGLQAAHDQGIVHRDLKPENIFLVARPDQLPLIKTLDFGISKIRHSQSFLTQDRTLMGTPLYMSPEQGEGEAKDVDHRSDIFSLGSICYEALYGDPPFNAPTISGIIYQIRFSEPEPGEAASPPFVGGLQDVLLRAMAKEKDDRYERVIDFARELSQALTVEGTVTQLESATPRMVDGAPAPAVGERIERRTGTTLREAVGELVEEPLDPRRGLRRRALAGLAAVGVASIVGAALLLKGVTPPATAPDSGPSMTVSSGVRPVEISAEGTSNQQDAALQDGTVAGADLRRDAELVIEPTAAPRTGAAASTASTAGAEVQTVPRRRAGAQPAAAPKTRTSKQPKMSPGPKSKPRPEKKLEKKSKKPKKGWIMDPEI